MIAAIRAARAAARATVWGHRSPIPATGPVIVDLDATLIGAHSEKEGATPNFKRGFGFHPLLAFIDHGAGGTGEPLVAMLRPGRANANTAADQIAVLDAALAQLPEQLRARVLVRGDSGSGVQPLLWHVHDLGLAYSVGCLGPPTRPGRVGGAAQAGLARRPGSRRPPPCGRPSRRADPVDAGHLHGLAARDAHHRPPRTSPPRRPAAHHRPRRLAHHRIRHQHHRRAAGRPGGPPPAARPRRRPHPWAQGHRPDQPALAGVRQEPGLARISLPGLRTAHLDPTAGLATNSPPEPGNPNACGCGYWPSPHASSPPAAAASCASRSDGPGPTSSPAATNASQHWPDTDQPATTSGPGEPATQRRESSMPKHPNTKANPSHPIPSSLTKDRG